MRYVKKTVVVGLTLLLAATLGGCGGDQSTDGTARIDGDAQTVTSGLTQNSYDPITVQEGIPVRWNLYVEEATLTSCNNEIIIPELGLQRTLSPGNNIIEFTPEKPGDILFTCWMGMIYSRITVVDQLPAK